ncbi:MAG: universal stress protein [Candidatus Obscuribacterales bacterium]|jgi:nucleotide-binding universal stress UspA family protein
MKILAAIDGSFQSEAAIDALGSFKWAGGTEIILFTVLKADLGLGFGRKAEDQTALLKEMAASTAESLKGIATDLEKNLPGCRVTFQIAEGEAKAEILDGAKANAVDMIIMGSRGHKGMELILLGSVSQGVLMQAQCPVVIVKSEASSEAPNLQEGFKNVLLTVDNSPYSRAALAWVKTLNWSSATRFKLVTVVQALTDSFASEESAVRATSLTRQHDSLHAMARSELEAMAQDLIEHVGPGRVTTQVGEGDPREVILHVASNWSADLIVMGSHGRTGLTKLLLGSVSHAVAVHGYCSVAIVKGVVPKGQGAKQQQTGMFKVPEAKEIVDRLPPPPPNSPTDTPHIQPGGMM